MKKIKGKLMCEIKFMFDYGALTCLWGVNGEGALSMEKFPISKELIASMEDLCTEFDTILNWDDPASGFVWLPSQIEDFRLRSQMIYDKLISELGDNYKVQNLINQSLNIKD